MNSSKVVILILNWNGGEDTIECLDSLINSKYEPFQIMIVDNGSDDNSLKIIRNYAQALEHPPQNFLSVPPLTQPLRILELDEGDILTDPLYLKQLCECKLIIMKNKENYGFCEGNNNGIEFISQYLNSDYILILNNDTIVHPDLIKDLTEFAIEDKNRGMVGPTVLYYHEPEKITFQGGNLNLCTVHLEHYQLNDKLTDYSLPVKLDYISGCCMLLKTDMLTEVGLLDPDFFLYLEDVDWCVRAHKQKYDIYHLPKARVWHKESVSSQKESPLSLYYGIRNNFLFLKKHCQTKRRYMTYLFLSLDATIYSLKFLFTGRFKEFHAIILALNDGLKGNYGYKFLK
jgi:GT2 family glycosyltransferase